MAHKHPIERARPTKPQDCADHRTMQKSFLNQICEDCLLAELDTEANPDRNGDNTHETSVPVQGSREGLIWDSEVRIEIEDQGLVSSTGAVVQAAPQPIVGPHDDRQIFESQVQITIQYEDHSGFEQDLPSPTFTASPPVCSSRTYSLGIFPASAYYTRSCQPKSPNYLSKRHGRDSQSRLYELDDADDEFDRIERLSTDSRQAERGRPLTRSNLHKVEKSEPEAEVPSQIIIHNITLWCESRRDENGAELGDLSDKQFILVRVTEEEPLPQHS
ncbi:hypothetical protein A1O7_01227 [Cladophialophora yegresii CBS 114405]|uniref:Uncharacterized protein n=1 Tax=Cladophialophora yegresii CBS 114405 TaxID=1182544 RepID=W9WAD1_9EURO|nr:uncharacterized protein A1O7_01227 [Cladophialophora yegresii CBS 114405]EXJ64888.1 hypothetical protein A1O7_01227 [Cladophialophora yegresii CBS 114405]